MLPSDFNDDNSVTTFIDESGATQWVDEGGLYLGDGEPPSNTPTLIVFLL